MPKRKLQLVPLEPHYLSGSHVYSIRLPAVFWQLQQLVNQEHDVRHEETTATRMVLEDHQTVHMACPNLPSRILRTMMSQKGGIGSGTVSAGSNGSWRW